VQDFFSLFLSGLLNAKGSAWVRSCLSSAPELTHSNLLTPGEWSQSADPQLVVASTPALPCATCLALKPEDELPQPLRMKAGGCLG